MVVTRKRFDQEIGSLREAVKELKQDCLKKERQIDDLDKIVREQAQMIRNLSEKGGMTTSQLHSEWLFGAEEIKT